MRRRLTPTINVTNKQYRNSVDRGSATLGEAIGNAVNGAVDRAKEFFEGIGNTLQVSKGESQKLVEETAAVIETAYPGEVVGINIEVKGADGKTATDFDIETKTAVIQIKAGGGNKLSGQIERTEKVTDKPVIGYGPKLKPSVVILRAFRFAG